MLFAFGLLLALLFDLVLEFAVDFDFAFALAATLLIVSGSQAIFSCCLLLLAERVAIGFGFVFKLRLGLDFGCRLLFLIELLSIVKLVPNKSLAKSCMKLRLTCI